MCFHEVSFLSDMVGKIIIQMYINMYASLKSRVYKGGVKLLWFIVSGNGNICNTGSIRIGCTFVWNSKNEP